MSSFCGEGCKDKKNDKANVLVEIAKHDQQLLAEMTNSGVGDCVSDPAFNMTPF